MARRMGDQTEYWQHHRPIDTVAGLYYDEELAGSQGMHFHLWIGDYSPNSREVRRAVKRLQNSRDMVSWSYSRCLPEKNPVGSLDPDSLPLQLVPPPFLGEVILRDLALEVISNLKALDGDKNSWLASEAARLEALLQKPDPAPGFTNEEVIEGSLRVTAGCLLDAANAHKSIAEMEMARIAGSIDSVLDIDTDVDEQDLSVEQKAIHVLRLTDDGDKLSPKHLKLLEMSVNRRLNDEGIKAFDAVYRDVVAGRYDAGKVWFCGVEHVTRDAAGYVYYKGQYVDHFSHDDFDEMRRDTKELALICQRLERLGRPVGIAEYLASFAEMKDFPAQKYFVTAPTDPRYGPQTRYKNEVVKVHPYKSQQELGEALKLYVTDWNDCPLKSAEELRTLYCSDADWRYAKGLNADDPDHRHSIIDRCACDDLVAASIIKAAKTGETQNIEGGVSNRVDWIRDKHIRGRYEFETIENIEDAERALARHSSPDAQRYDWHIYPNIAEALKGILDDGKLMRKDEVLNAFVKNDTTPLTGEFKPNETSSSASANPLEP